MRLDQPWTRWPSSVQGLRNAGRCDTKALFHSRAVSRFRNIERVASRKLLQIHAATELGSLRVPSGNQLEALKADPKGQHSIRVNDQWRICFVWKTDGAHRVGIVDYHQEFEHGQAARRDSSGRDPA